MSWDWWPQPHKGRKVHLHISKDPLLDPYAPYINPILEDPLHPENWERHRQTESRRHYFDWRGGHRGRTYGNQWTALTGTSWKSLTPAKKRSNYGVPGGHEGHRKWIPYKRMSGLGQGYRSPYRTPYKNRSPYRYARYRPPIRPGFRSARTLFQGQAARYRAANPRVGGFNVMEKKFLDETKAATSIVATTAGAEMDPTTVNCCNAIAAGAGESQRIGRNVKILSWHIKGTLIHTAGAGATLKPSTVVRLIFLLDKQTNGAQFNSEDVIEDATNVEHGFRNLENSSRFRILKDTQFTLNNATSAGDGAVNDSGETSRTFKYNFRFRGLKSHYKSSTPSVADITTNSLHIMAFASAAGDTLQYESRVRYTE